MMLDEVMFGEVCWALEVESCVVLDKAPLINQASSLLIILIDLLCDLLFREVPCRHVTVCAMEAALEGI